MRTELFEDENTLEECNTCKKETPLNELLLNSNFASYNCRLICDRCASKIDADIDAQEQDKA